MRRQEMIRRAASEAALLASRSIRWLWLPDAAPTGPSLSQLAGAFGRLLPRHVLEPASDQDHSLPVVRRNSVTPQLYSSPNPSLTGGPVGGGSVIGPPTAGSVVSSGRDLWTAVAPPISQDRGSPRTVRRGGRLSIFGSFRYSSEAFRPATNKHKLRQPSVELFQSSARKSVNSKFDFSVYTMAGYLGRA